MPYDGTGTGMLREQLKDAFARPADGEVGVGINTDSKGKGALHLGAAKRATPLRPIPLMTLEPSPLALCARPSSAFIRSVQGAA